MEPRESEHGAWPPPWLKRVRSRVGSWCVSTQEKSWVVAVSGGSDSVGLLRVLHGLSPELGLTLSVAHLDHGVRGDAARRDAAFVEELGRLLGLPVDLGRWQPTRPGHFETDARRARYAWLREIAAARNASAIALGHTLDDQAETVLHRIVRGTGLRGLSGIPQRRVLGGDPPVMLVRPLISLPRQAIRDYLAALGQAFQEDASNTDLTRTRARIRHDLLPRLAAEYNPRVAEALVRLGSVARASERVLERRVIEIEAGVIRIMSPERVVLDRDRLREQPLFLRAEFLRRVWRQAGWPELGMSARRWNRLARLVSNSEIEALSIGAGITLRTTGAMGLPAHGFVLERTGTSPSQRVETAHCPEIMIEVPGSVAWQGVMIETVLEPNEACEETIDLDQVVPPLRVRGPVSGDRFEPLGMGGATTPLNDFFRARKVPRSERPRTPLLCDARGIIWVAGHRIAERVKVSDRTLRTLGLRSGSGRDGAARGPG
jgi:tRNA(Ile)-lysidine synthase